MSRQADDIATTVLFYVSVTIALSSSAQGVLSERERTTENNTSAAEKRKGERKQPTMRKESFFCPLVAEILFF